jgi:UDPglucose 6-dehydrogenase
MGAELIKHFSNAVLAVNRVLAADLALVCKDFGIDYRRVLDGITTDHRMPPDLLEVRPGIGDSCLAKDLRALQAVSTLQTERRQFFDITLQRSEAQRAHATQSLVNAVRQHPATRPVVLMLGLTYTPGIGDVRDALSRDIYDALADIAVIRCWDPYVSEDDKKAFFPRAQSFDSLDAAFSGSSFSVALVKHPELDGFDWRMAQSNMFDPRLIFDYAEVLDASVAARLKQPVLTWPSL